MESSLLTRDQALSLWSGSINSKTIDCQSTNRREYHIVRTHTRETTVIQALASPNYQKHPVQDASSKQQTKQKYKPNHQQTGLPPHSASPSEEKQTSKQRNKNSQISPCKKLTQTTGSTLENRSFQEEERIQPWSLGKVWNWKFSCSVMSDSLQPHGL